MEKVDIGLVLAMEVIEPTQTERASPIVFEPKKYRILYSSVSYRRGTL